MTEILTESFCERCGTRYTFESSAPRKSRIGRVRMAAKGVKNFVMSDEASFSEAMADARGEEELAVTAHQLDAFHKTFNFCLTCRQYTCGDCWNPADGRCLTCAPMAGVADPAFASAPMTVAPTNGATNGHHEPAPVADEVWPEVDLSRERLARALGTNAAFAAAAAAEDEVPSQLEVDAANDAFTDAAAATSEPDVAEAVEASAFAPDLDEAVETSAFEPETETSSFAATGSEPDLAVAGEAVAEDAYAFDADDAWAAADPAVAAATAAAAMAAQPPASIDAAGEAEADAEFEAQASLAEQDATVEAVMDPALDFDVDDADALYGVEPGQSLEDAVAAYEARLVAEEQEHVTAPMAEPVAAALVDADLEPEIEAPLAEPELVLEPEAVAEPDVEPESPVAALAAYSALEFAPEEPEAAVAAPEIEAAVAEPEALAAEPEAELDWPSAEPAAIAAEPEAELAWPSAEPAAIAAEPEAELDWPSAEPAAIAAVEPEAELDWPSAEPAAIVAEPEAEPVFEAPVAAVAAAAAVAHVVEPEPEAIVAEPEVAAVAEPEPEPVAEAEPVAPIAAASEAELAWPAADLSRQPAEVTDEAIDAALLLAMAGGPAEAEAEPEPIVAEPEPEPVAVEVAAEPEPEPIAAAAEPEPVAAAAEPEPRVDVVPQPTWPTPAAPDVQPVAPTPTPTPGPDGAVPWLMVAPTEEAAARPEPQWPATPVWRAGARNTDAPTTLAGRTLLPQPDSSALWAASAQQVLSGSPADIAAAAAVAQPCVQCGLSLSANARFCRRCGTRQG